MLAWDACLCLAASSQVVGHKVRNSRRHVMFGTVGNSTSTSNGNAVQLVDHAGAEVEAAASRANAFGQTGHCQTV